MKGFGTSSHLEIGDRVYYIETSYLSAQGEIFSKVTREGKVVSIKRIEVDKDLEERKIFETLKNFHENLVNEIKTWLSIKEKVKEEPLEMYVKLAEKMLRIGLLEESKELLEDKIKLNENYGPLNFVLGQIYFYLKDYEKSSLFFEKAIQDRDYANYFLWAGRVFRIKNEFTRSISYLKKAIEKNPSYAEAHFEMGLSLLDLVLNSGSTIPFKTIILSFKSAEILDPRFRNEKFKNGLTLLENGEIVEAKRLFEEFFYSLKPHDVHEILEEFIILTKYADREKLRIVVDDYILKLKELRDEHPEYADVRFNLALAFFIKIKTLFEEAQIELENALSINPDYEAAKKALELLKNESEGFALFIKTIGRL
ncbi:MAG: tetratricopeptide repeat protein [Candidatus Hydrothermales bacterium]